MPGVGVAVGSACRRRSVGGRRRGTRDDSRRRERAGRDARRGRARPAPEPELAPGDGHDEGDREEAEDDEQRTALHRPKSDRVLTEFCQKTGERPVRAGGRGVGICGDGGPDRIRTGDLQRDRLACWAATPRVQLRRGRSIARSAAPPVRRPTRVSPDAVGCIRPGTPRRLRPMIAADRGTGGAAARILLGHDPHRSAQRHRHPSHAGDAPRDGRGRGRRRRLRGRPDRQRPRGARRRTAREGGRPVRRLRDDGQPRRPSSPISGGARRRSPDGSTTWCSTRPRATPSSSAPASARWRIGPTGRSIRPRSTRPSATPTTPRADHGPDHAREHPRPLDGPAADAGLHPRGRRDRPGARRPAAHRWRPVLERGRRPGRRPRATWPTRPTRSRSACRRPWPARSVRSSSAIAPSSRGRGAGAKLVGGGMRQAGILAAAGLVALSDGPDGTIERLAEDHANARRLAEALSGMAGIVVGRRDGPARDRTAGPRSSGAPTSSCSAWSGTGPQFLDALRARNVADGGVSARTGPGGPPLRRDGRGHRHDHRRRPRGPCRDQPATTRSDTRRLRDLTHPTPAPADRRPAPEGHPLTDDLPIDLPRPAPCRGPRPARRRVLRPRRGAGSDRLLAREPDPGHARRRARPR